MSKGKHAIQERNTVLHKEKRRQKSLFLCSWLLFLLAVSIVFIIGKETIETSLWGLVVMGIVLLAILLRLCMVRALHKKCKKGVTI